MSKTICPTSFFTPFFTFKQLNRDLFRDNPNRNEHDSDEYRIEEWEKKFLIPEVRFDGAVYPFTGNVYGYYKPNAENSELRVCVAEIFMPIEGRGQTLEEAKLDWDRQFHQTFQEIYTKQNWERTKDEQKLWEMFESAVDIPAHRKLTPLKFGQTGKIIRRISSDQCEIEWIGDRRDIVSYDDCPSELLQYEIEKYFRADVLREYGTDKLIKICSISVSDYRQYTHEELDKIIESLPTTSNFPESTNW
jgi:hypothetical protein